MKKEKIYYAHSTENFSESQWQVLQDYLYQIAEMSDSFVYIFVCKKL